MHTFVTDRRKTLCLPTTGETSMQSQNVCVSIKTITGYAQFQTNRFLNIRQSKNAFRLTDQHIMTKLSCGLSNEHSCKKKRVISHNVFFTILDLYQNEFSFSRTNLRADAITLYISCCCLIGHQIRNRIIINRRLFL
jgi:hypothetical protein